MVALGHSTFPLRRSVVAIAPAVVSRRRSNEASDSRGDASHMSAAMRCDDCMVPINRTMRSDPIAIVSGRIASDFK
jgi:hypothetical protein